MYAETVCASGIPDEPKCKPYLFGSDIMDMIEDCILIS